MSAKTRTTSNQAGKKSLIIRTTNNSFLCTCRLVDGRQQTISIILAVAEQICTNTLYQHIPNAAGGLLIPLLNSKTPQHRCRAKVLVRYSLFFLAVYFIIQNGQEHKYSKYVMRNRLNFNNIYQILTTTY